jgi:MoaA/NifB/PqqE/SkfB family radical SAM enzyme
MLKCKMCHFWENDISFQDANWLSVKEYKNFFYDLREFVDDSFLISFGGGEPLLITNLFDILKICREIGFRSYFPTNAYLIDNRIAKKIAEADVFSIGISLDSINRETHDFLRGKEGCWQRAMRAIELLEKNCPDILINILTIITEANLEEIIDLTEWVYNHPRLHGIVFQAIQRPFNAHCPENWYELQEYAGLWPTDTAKVNSIIDELIALRFSCKKAFKICNPISQLELFKLYFANPRQFVKPARCHLGDNVVRIDCFGNVILCNEMDSIGNIKETNIRQIWYSQRAEEIRMRIYNCNKNCHHLVNCFYDGESP